MDFGWYGDEDVDAAVAFVAGAQVPTPTGSARSACRWVAKK